MVKKRGEIIAVDLGGTNLRVALLRDYKIIKYIKKKTPLNKKGILKELFDSISELKNEKVIGIGIGAPGPLKEGVIKNAPNIALKNFNLKKFVKKKFKVRVEVENDASCVALAEYKLGVKKDNFFVLTLGTGIGGGVIIDGKLYDRGNLGGELGYIYLTPEKSFEELAGAKAVSRISRKYLKKELMLSELMRLHNSKSREILEKLTDYMGQGIGSLINVFNPEVVVLAGGMSNAGQTFLQMIRKKTKKYILLPGKYNIMWSRLKEPGILGAALLLD